MLGSWVRAPNGSPQGSLNKDSLFYLHQIHIPTRRRQCHLQKPTQPRRDKKESCNIRYNSLQVGMTRLELATSRPPDACANQLRYIPMLLKSECKDIHLFRIDKILAAFFHSSGNIFTFFLSYVKQIKGCLQRFSAMCNTTPCSSQHHSTHLTTPLHTPCSKAEAPPKVTKTILTFHK